jgi:uncharacterized membrane protein (Fun14 family)
LAPVVVVAVVAVVVGVVAVVVGVVAVVAVVAVDVDVLSKLRSMAEGSVVINVLLAMRDS